VVDVDSEITEDRARLIACSILNDAGGWVSEQWNGNKKWFPLSFDRNAVTENSLAALIYAWHQGILRKHANVDFPFDGTAWTAIVGENVLSVESDQITA
jgi:hypothetical protein